MPIAHSPKPFQPKAQESVVKRSLWLFPAALALVFVVLIAGWANVNDAQLRQAYQQTLVADASSVEAQLSGRQEMEKVRLREVASRLPMRRQDANAALATMPEVIAGMDRLWNRLVWLDENNQVVARAERKAPILANATDELRIQSAGQADHFAEAVLDANGKQVGQLLARYDMTDLLQSTDLAWLNHRYEVNFISELGEVIATTANSANPPQGDLHERPLMGFKDITLRLTPYEAAASWKHNTRTLVLLAGLILMGFAASLLTRHEMRQVARANADSQNEAAWRQSMEDSALVGLRARDAEGRILYVNKTLCDMVGYTRPELVGLMPPLPFWPPDAVDDLMARNLNTLAGGAPSTGFETRWKHRDGHLLDVMIFESGLVNSRGIHIGWMGSIIDISTRKQLEEKDRHHTEILAQHARLNDMGLLASELAHELNQPLTTIVSYSAGLSMALKKDPSLDPEILSAMDEVNRHARKAGDTVNWIRRQTSRSELVRKQHDVNTIVADVLALRQRQIQRSHVILVLDLGSDLPTVLADRIGIEQVLTNLVRNAVDALTSNSGERRIQVSSCVKSIDHDVSMSIEVCVRDNGHGLGGRTIDMLCSTFYSTKSEGMGLGLGICRSIVESHGGTLVAEEAPGGGAQFSFTLPIVTSAT
jgi:two-component system sensor histidine kinase DctS